MHTTASYTRGDVRYRQILGAVGIVAGMWGLSAGGRAQEVFRSGVSLILVDVRVVDEGKPVADLRPDEVKLLVDGRARKITSLTYEPALTRSSGTRAEKAHSGKHALAAGEETPSHAIVFVVARDSMTANDAARVLKNAEDFIGRLSGDYRVAVATLPFSADFGFTRDREAAKRALAEALEGARRRQTATEDIGEYGCEGRLAASGCESDGVSPGDTKARAMNMAADVQQREAAMVHGLQWLFTILGREGTPTDVVLVHGGLPWLDRMRPAVERLLDVARIGRIRVHVLELAELGEIVPRRAPSPDVDIAPFSLGPPAAAPASYGLAPETGGIEVLHAVTGQDFFARLDAELAGSYLLGFEPLPSERDGRPHRIEIQIARRPYAIVHARKSFVAAPAGAASGSLSLAALTRRAGEYVEHFERAFSTVVAEERYVQAVKLWDGNVPVRDDEPALAWRSDAKEEQEIPGVLRRRQLLSDVLMVQTPGQSWMCYRDVAEVDGKAIRDRSLRVQKLFLSGRPGDREQLQRIADESARQNIGASRNINAPTFPLQLLLPSTIGRFAITQYPDEASGAECCTVIGLDERLRPALVQRFGRDVPLKAVFWIEPATGRVRRARLLFPGDKEDVIGAFEVTYRPTKGLDVLIPESLWEWYLTPDPEYLGRRAYVEGRATYGNVRRFTVRTEEALK